MISASTNERQNAYTLPRKRGQSVTIFARTASAPREHGLTRYRRRQRKAQPWSYLDHHPTFPGKLLV